MRIHSDHLDELEIRKAARLAGVRFTRFTVHGSRSREAGFDVILTGSSPRRQNQGEDMAATWDEWGIFLAHLFTTDEHAIAGRGGYESAEHFHWATGHRYTGSFGLADQHQKGHNWQYASESVTGSYFVVECGGSTGCGAIRRWLNGRGSFADFIASNR